VNTWLVRKFLPSWWRFGEMFTAKSLHLPGLVWVTLLLVFKESVLISGLRGHEPPGLEPSVGINNCCLHTHWSFP
jgi:hypothetical protein